MAYLEEYLYSQSMACVQCDLSCLIHANTNERGIMIILLEPGKNIKNDPDSHRGITLLVDSYIIFEKGHALRIKSFLEEWVNEGI